VGVHYFVYLKIKQERWGCIVIYHRLWHYNSVFAEGSSFEQNSCLSAVRYCISTLFGIELII
jgi:hypothetical protein